MHANDANDFLKNKIVAVVGRGFLVGKPIAEWLNGKCGKLIVLNSKSNLRDLQEADLVITGVGKAGLIKPTMLKPGAGVIDFGYDVKKIRHEKGEMGKKIFGDFDSSSLVPNLSPLLSHLSFSFYTPTLGGPDPILVAEIFKNFYKLNSNSN